VRDGVALCLPGQTLRGVRKAQKREGRREHAHTTSLLVESDKREGEFVETESPLQGTQGEGGGGAGGVP